jgi:hypothetical protein
MKSNWRLYVEDLDFRLFSLVDDIDWGCAALILVENLYP